MKKELQKKLNAYAAAAGTIVAAGAAHAQINYVDINPDTILHDSLVYNLDFDNNGQPELRFETVVYQASFGTVHLAQVNVLGDTTNAVLGSLYSSQYPLPFALNNGDSISGTNPSWNAQPMNNGLQYLGINVMTYNYGNWLGATDKYLGVRFKIGTETHYGWVRLSVTSIADSIIIKDYAYEALPNIGLTAGQTVGIHDHSALGNVRIFSSANTVVVNNPEFAKGGTIRILNTIGETVYEGQATDETTRISLEGSPVGIYLVQFIRDGQSFTQKVYIH
jgi:hypothetical protein